MKIFFVSVLVFLEFILPSALLASSIELPECVEISHCVREEWDIRSIEHPFKDIQEIIKNFPRTMIVELNGNYLHAEVTSKWMKYVDDLEVSYVPEAGKLLIRSESRVGESDLGVNQKRVNSLKSKLF